MAENDNPSKLTKKRKKISSGSTGTSNEGSEKETEQEVWNRVEHTELVDQKDTAVTEKVEAVRELNEYKKLYADQQTENQKCRIELNIRESELKDIYNFMAPNIKNFFNRQRLTPQQSISIPGSYHSNPQGQHLQRHPPPPTGAVLQQRHPPPQQPGTAPPQRQSFVPQTGDMQRPQQPSISLQQVTSTV
uniref:Uncharacterized protein n=1 Tax=Panagrolaimus sp. PS1159 TaxID=55785 RepID=A0AC35GB94_9BILA